MVAHHHPSLLPPVYTQAQVVCNACGGHGNKIAHACSLCGGAKVINEKAEIEVEIPPGAEEGEVFNFEGESDESVDLDVEAGDVIVKITSDPSSSLFRRRATHLYTTRTLALPDALLGFKDVFPHMDGHNVTVSRLGGVTQPGHVVVVKGGGMPVRGAEGKHGNLYVEYQVVLPDKVEGDLRTVLNRVWNRTDEGRERESEGGHDEL